MARGFNKVVLMGNLARDPDVRYTVERRAWARFTVAAGYSWKNKNGEYQDGADFVPVVAWGPLGERCGRYLKKGSGVLVEGRIRTRSYEARDGSGKKYITEVEASEVVFVGGRRTEDGQTSSYEPAAPAAAPSSAAFPNDEDFGKSISEKGFDRGFGDDFPMDFAEMEKDGKDSEADIPF
ncbi:MAG: single-stranded DNA-binding protein [Fretibacterium sp.]|nr:single-stranded DNA-binding protein [Fretibacterium sp.]